MNNLSKIFGKRVKALRKARNMIQYDYAEFVGINLKTLWNIEQARRSIHFDTIEKIADKENIAYYKLFLDDDEMETNCNREICNLVDKLDKKSLDVVKKLLEMIKNKALLSDNYK